MVHKSYLPIWAFLQGSKPASWKRGLPVLLLLSLLAGAATWWAIKFPENLSEPERFGLSLGITIVNGGIISFFMEFVHKIWNITRKREGEGTPRWDGALVGLIERILVWILAIVLLNPCIDDGPTLLTIALTGYVAAKSFVRERTGTTNTMATVVSIWGTSLSVAFGALGGWIYWHS